MNENVNDIESAFHTPIEEHEEKPPERVWDDIDHQLDKNSALLAERKYRRLKLVSAVLVLLLAITFAYQLRSKTSGLQSSGLAGRGPLTNIKNSDHPGNLTDRAPRFKPGDAVDNRDKAVVAPQKISAAKLNSMQIKTDVINIRGAENIYVAGKRMLKASARADIARSIPFTTQPADQDPTIDQRYKLENLSRDNSSNGIDHSLLASGMALNTDPEKTRLIQPGRVANPGISFIVGINNTVDHRGGLSATQMSSKPVGPRQHAFHFSIMPYFAPQFNFNRIVDDDDTGIGQGQQRGSDDIKNDENHQTSYNMGIRIEIPLKKRWAIQSGINYLNKSVEIEPKKIFARLDNNGNIEYRFDFSAGYTYLLPKNGNMPSIGDSITAAKSSSNLQYIGIPLSIAYSFLNGKFKIVPSVGACINFLVKQNMETNLLTGVSNEKQHITSINGLKKTYFNTITGIGLQYNPGRKIAVSIEPATSFALGTITRNAAVKSYPNAFSIMAGVKIYF